MNKYILNIQKNLILLLKNDEVVTFKECNQMTSDWYINNLWVGTFVDYGDNNLEFKANDLNRAKLYSNLNFDGLLNILGIWSTYYYDFCKFKLEKTILFNGIPVFINIKKVGEMHRNFVQSLTLQLKNKNIGNYDLELRTKGKYKVDYILNGFILGFMEADDEKIISLQVVTKKEVRWYEDITLAIAVTFIPEWIKYWQYKNK